MRIATRRAAGLDAEGWTGELRSQVEDYFDGIAAEWHTRITPQRTAVVTDALCRGLDAIDVPDGPAVEVGSGIGTYSSLLAERFATVVAIDLSLAMLKLAPIEPARRIQADGARLPLRDSSAAAIVLINAFLFPAEVNAFCPQAARWYGSTAAVSKRRFIFRSTISSRGCLASGRVLRAGQVRVTGACFGARDHHRLNRRPGSFSALTDASPGRIVAATNP